MDDVAKAGGFGVLLGGLVFGAFVGYRVQQDQTLLYIVVIGMLGIGAIFAVGVTAAYVHRFSHTEAELMDAYSANDLTRARRERTRPAPAQIGSGDFLSAMIAGMPGADTVDVAPAASGPQWEDDD